MPEMRAEKPKKRIPTIWPVHLERPGWQSAIDSEDNTSQTAGRMQLRHQNSQICFR